MTQTVTPINVCDQCCKLEKACDRDRCDGEIVTLHPNLMLEAGNGLTIYMDEDGKINLVEPLEVDYIAPDIRTD